MSLISMLVSAVVMLAVIVVLYILYCLTILGPKEKGTLISFGVPVAFKKSRWYFPLKPFQYIHKFPKGPQRADYEPNKVSTRPGKSMVEIEGEEKEVVRTMEIVIDSAIYYEFPDGDELLKTVQFVEEGTGTAAERASAQIQAEVISKLRSIAGTRTWEECYWSKEDFQQKVNKELSPPKDITEEEKETYSVVSRLRLKNFKVEITKVDLPDDFKHALDDMEVARVRKTAKITDASAEALSIIITRSAVRKAGIDIQALQTLEKAGTGPSTILLPIDTLSRALGGMLQSRTTEFSGGIDMAEILDSPEIPLKLRKELKDVVAKHLLSEGEG